MTLIEKQNYITCNIILRNTITTDLMRIDVLNVININTLRFSKKTMVNNNIRNSTV